MQYQKNIYELESKKKYYTKSDFFRILLIRELMKEVKQKKILDIGCANGTTIEPFIKRNRVYGIDISEGFLKKAKKKGIITKKADIEKSLPYHSNYFDIVLCSEVIEHIVNTDKLLFEINRVLKRNGRLIITIPNVNTVVSFLMSLFDLPPYLSARYKSPHVRDFTLKTIKIALENHGFKISKVKGIPILFLKNLKFLTKMPVKIFRNIFEIFIIEAIKEKNIKFDLTKSYSFSVLKIHD